MRYPNIIISVVNKEEGIAEVPIEEVPGVDDLTKIRVDYHSISYISGLTEELIQLIGKHGFSEIRMVYRPVKELEKLVHNMKDRIELLQQNYVVGETRARRGT